MAAYLTKASTARMWSSTSAPTAHKAASIAATRSYSTKLARSAPATWSIKNSRAGAYRSLSSSAKRFEEQLKSGTLQSPSELARKLSEAALPLIPRPDVKKVLVVGSGGLSIGQAGEFDYSGGLLFRLINTHVHSSLSLSLCDEQYVIEQRCVLS